MPDTVISAVRGEPGYAPAFEGLAGLVVGEGVHESVEPGLALAFDAVATDLTMPDMSGVDFAREILAIRPDVPIVLMSGYVRPEDAEAARELGVGTVLPARLISSISLRMAASG